MSREYKHLPQELQDAEEHLLRMQFMMIVYKARLLWWVDALTEGRYVHGR